MTKVLSTTMTATPSNGNCEESQLKRKTDALFKVGDYQRVLRLIDAFILEHPEQPIGRAISARALAADGQIGKALKELYRFYKLDGVLSEELLLEISRSVLNHDNDWVRCGAAEALSDLGDKRAIPTLINRLKHGDDEIQRRCSQKRWQSWRISVLYPPWQIASTSTITKDYDPDPHEILAALGDKCAIPTLINLLKYHDNKIQCKAAETLVKLGDERVISALIDCLNHHDENDWSYDSEAVRRRVAEMLATVG